MLAIVIPFYKGAFFRSTLSSIKAQTDQRFHVYIGDDASPEDLQCILHDLNDDEWINNKITVKRFSENLGKHSLVKHWARCVEMIADEEWIWLFSDDDLMDTNCVASFYHQLKVTAASYPLYKFDTIVIDKNDSTIRQHETVPTEIDPFDLIFKKLHGHLHTFAVEYIFSKKVFDQSGGFVDFPLAWGSDDATWVKFAGGRKISVIQSAKVKWRLSDQNISGIVNANGEQKSKALLLYGRWIVSHFKDHQDISKLKKSMCNFILQQVKGYLGGISLKNAFKLYSAGSSIWGLNPMPVIRIFISR